MGKASVVLPFDPSPNQQTPLCMLRPAEDKSHNCLKHSRAGGRLRGLGWRLPSQLDRIGRFVSKEEQLRK